MDDAKRKLAECWRDLVGWHKGMVNEFGHVCDEAKDSYASFSDAPHSAGYGAGANAAWVLPDPDALANWGVWAAWAQEHVPGISLPPFKFGFADELLRRVYLELRAEEGPGAPASVQAWWAEQQKESR